MKKSNFKSLKTTMAVMACGMSWGGLLPLTLADAPDIKGARPSFLQRLDDTVAVQRQKVIHPSDRLGPFDVLVSAVKQYQNSDGTWATPLQEAYAAACQALHQYQQSIESVAVDFRKADPFSFENFFAVVLDYYNMKSILHTVMESANANEIKLPGLSLDALDLELPPEVHQKVLEYQSADILAKKGEAFDGSFRLGSSDCAHCTTARKKLSFTDRELLTIQSDSFSIMPRKNVGPEMLRFQALKAELFNQSHLNSYLYSDEMAQFKLPQNSPAYAKRLLDRSNEMQQESLYRQDIIGYLSQTLSAKLMGTSQPEFESKVLDLFTDLGVYFRRRLDLEKLSAVLHSEEIALMAGQGDIRALAYAMSAIGKKYVELEKERRQSYIASVLASSPEYFISMPRERLIEVIHSSIKGIFYDSVSTMLYGSFLDLDRLTWLDRAYLHIVITSLEEDYFKRSLIDEEILSTLERKRSQGDAITTRRRYALAEKILVGVRHLDGLRDKISKIENLAIVPIEMLPTDEEGIDVSLIFLDMKPAKHAPAWPLVMLQSMASRVDHFDPDDQKSPEVVQAKTLRAPQELLQAAQFAAWNATEEALEKIKEFHERNMSFQAYKAESMDLRFSALMRQIPEVGARSVLASLLKINKIAQSVGAASLGEKIKKAFEDLMAGEREGLDALVTEIDRGNSYIQGHRAEILPLLASRGPRYEAARKLFRDPAVYKKYLYRKIDDFQNMMPILFIPVKLPPDVAEETYYKDEPVQLYEIVRRLRKYIVGSATKDLFDPDRVINDLIAQFAAAQWTRSTFGSADSPIKRDVPTLLAEPVHFGFEPYPILRSVLAGTRKGKKIGIVRAITDALSDNPAETPDGLAEELQVNDPSQGAIDAQSIWPQTFKVRDLLPVVADGSSSSYLIEKMVISSLLSPYLKASLMRSDRNLLKCADLNQDCTEELTHNNAYQEAIKASEGGLSGDLSEAQKEAFKYHAFFKAGKENTAKTQAMANKFINYTAFIEVPQWMHMASSVLMILSSIVDYSMDSGITYGYWMDYDILKPYAYSNGLGEGLARYSDAEHARQERDSHLQALADRTPMDLTWWVESFHGYAQAAKQLFEAEKVQLKGGQRDEFLRDINHLAEAYNAVGVEFRIDKTFEFKSQFQKKMIEIQKGVKSNTLSRKDAYKMRKEWESALKTVKGFSKKYRPFLKTVAKAKAASLQSPSGQEKK